jgi:NAD(P)-dependent dehydrogenase (short-subunit alcohol dehydrogenase family)
MESIQKFTGRNARSWMNGKLVGATALVAGGYLLFRRVRRRSLVDLRGKVVLITGGSRGLGLATAREFGSRGAIVAVCARNKEHLDRATADLRARGEQAHSFVCDITDREQVQALVADVTKLLGPIDILVNNAGVIKVGPLLQMEFADFEQAMSVMFWGMLNTTLAVLPTMRSRKQGSIVNVTSIGGKVVVPHLLPYCCAKFAAVALSEGLGVELAAEGIHVTTIVPGLLRTGSHLNARFKGNQRAEYRWFAAGATTPAVSISAERAARSLVRATIRSRREKILSVPAEVLARVQGVTPALGRALIDVANRLLPGSGGDNGHSRIGRGLDVEVNSTFWRAITKLGQDAAASLNQIPPDGKTELAERM